ncbi:MAG: hypothetical protein U0R78_05300 [Nocardioidaceae bacterium]
MAGTGDPNPQQQRRGGWGCGRRTASRGSAEPQLPVEANPSEMSIASSAVTVRSPRATWTESPSSSAAPGDGEGVDVQAGVDVGDLDAGAGRCGR